MAAIDKLYLKHFEDFDDLRTWALIHKPSLFNNLIRPFDISPKSWENRTEDEYNSQKKLVKQFFAMYPTIFDYRDVNKNYMSDAEIERGWDLMIELEEQLKNELEYLENNISFPVANFTLKQDRWLFWHCPLDFIRNYLIEQCGYKEKWYHKLLFKFTMKHD